VRQRLSLAVAMVHKPELLILDEPTSGVDPIARDAFWRADDRPGARDKVTIFISTHFMNEAERCDRMSLMHAGKVLDSDTPARWSAARRGTLEEAFIGYLIEAGRRWGAPAEERHSAARCAAFTAHRRHQRAADFSVWPALSQLCAWREALELQRDPVRATMALLGSLLLMFVMGYGISMDVEDLRFAVLDRDQTVAEPELCAEPLRLALLHRAPAIADYADLDRRMRSGELALAHRDSARLRATMLRAASRADWRLDRRRDAAARRDRAGLCAGHAPGLAARTGARTPRASGSPGAARIETRFRYNPDVKSLPAMVPAVIPLLLLMIPAMLTALAVVREKELGSIINLYVTPVTRSEFLLGKQLPYVALAMLNFC
jgi:ribosome-dependent ATPase